MRANDIRATIQPIQSNLPFERVHIGLMDLKSDPSGLSKWILHAKDHFSEFTLLYPLENKTSMEVARKLNTFMNYLGIPSMIQADNEKEFEGVVTASLTKRGVDILHGRPRSSKVQGLVEKGNGSIKDRLAIWEKATNRKDWHRGLELIERVINTSTCAGLPPNVTPWELVYGRPQEPQEDGKRARMDMSYAEILELAHQGVFPDCVSEVWDKFPVALAHLFDEVATPSNIKHSQEIFAELYEKNREHQATIRAKMAAEHATRDSTQSFDVGDYVEVRLAVEPRSSLITKRFGALIISKRGSPHPTYKVLSKWGLLDREVIFSEMNKIKQEMVPQFKSLLLAAPRDKTISTATIEKSNSISEAVPVSRKCKKRCRRRTCQCVMAEVKCTLYCGHGEIGCDDLGVALEGSKPAHIPRVAETVVS